MRKDTHKSTARTAAQYLATQVTALAMCLLMAACTLQPADDFLPTDPSKS